MEFFGDHSSLSAVYSDVIRSLKVVMIRFFELYPATCDVMSCGYVEWYKIRRYMHGYL